MYVTEFVNSTETRKVVSPATKSQKTSDTATDGPQCVSESSENN